MQRKLENKLCSECMVVHAIQVFVCFIDIVYNKIIRQIQYKTKKACIVLKAFKYEHFTKRTKFYPRSGGEKRRELLVPLWEIMLSPGKR